MTFEREMAQNGTGITNIMYEWMEAGKQQTVFNYICTFICAADNYIT